MDLNGLAATILFYPCVSHDHLRALRFSVEQDHVFTIPRVTLSAENDDLSITDRAEDVSKPGPLAWQIKHQPVIV